MSPIRILLIDDHFVVRSGLTSSLEIEPDMQVIAAADNIENALHHYLTQRPDIVIMDMQLPDIDGSKGTALIREIDKNARILIFSTFAKDEQIIAAIEAGASGYLQKSADRSQLILAIRQISQDRTFFPKDLQVRLQQLQLTPGVTAREREILQQVAKGSANKQIALQLGITEDTVKQHVSRILQKLAVNDRAQATAEAIRRGIISLDETH